MKKFALIFLLELTLIACGGFAYQYYGLSLPTECYSSGKLLGSDPSQDLALTVCEPDAQVQGKCVVMEINEFQRLRDHLADVENQLKACQGG